jgi:hypothetical protein
LESKKLHKNRDFHIRGAGITVVLCEMLIAKELDIKGLMRTTKSISKNTVRENSFGESNEYNGKHLGENVG